MTAEDKVRDMSKEIEELAGELDEIKPIAEWLAIEHGKTRLQWNEHIKGAGDFRDFLKILGYTKSPIDTEKLTVISKEDNLKFWDKGNQFVYQYFIRQLSTDKEKAKQIADDILKLDALGLIQSAYQKGQNDQLAHTKQEIKKQMEAQG